MEQKVLSQIDVYVDTVEGVKIDNQQLKNNLQHFLLINLDLSKVFTYI